MGSVPEMRWLLIVVLLVSCASEPTSSPRPGETLATFATFQDAAEAIGCTQRKEVGTGGNPGLRAFGICEIDGQNLDIYLIEEGAGWEYLANDFMSVKGPGWIVIGFTTEVVRTVQDRIGGQLNLRAKPLETTD